MIRLLALYHGLEREALDCLELTCRYPGQVLAVPESQMSRLQDLDLLQYRGPQGWQPSWWGWAVLNWHRQLCEARDRRLVPSRPREMENGVHPGPACAKFRPLLFSGVLCWCGRLRSEHPDQAPEIALSFLAYQCRKGRLAHPRFRVSGRSFRDLVRELPAEVRESLDLIEPEGATLAQLFQLLCGRLRFLAVQETMSFLQERDLVFYHEEALRWHLSWDGLGVVNWLRERVLRNFLGKPMSRVFCGENGETLQPSACDRFRPLLSKGSKSCWCGHLSVAHAFRSE